MIAPENVPGALTAAGQTSETVLHQGPIEARPEQFEELPDVVDHLRAGRAVLLLLEGFVDGAARRQGLAFVSGAACEHVRSGGLDEDLGYWAEQWDPQGRDPARSVRT